MNDTFGFCNRNFAYFSLWSFECKYLNIEWCNSCHTWIDLIWFWVNVQIWSVFANDSANQQQAFCCVTDLSAESTSRTSQAAYGLWNWANERQKPNQIQMIQIIIAIAVLGSRCVPMIHSVSWFMPLEKNSLNKAVCGVHFCRSDVTLLPLLYVCVLYKSTRLGHEEDLKDWIGNSTKLSNAIIFIACSNQKKCHIFNAHPFEQLLRHGNRPYTVNTTITPKGATI